MRRTWVAAVGVLALGLTGLARAADHQDGPAAKADPTSDITDIYGWMSADASKVYLVMDVTPAAMAQSQFSQSVKYVFNLNSRPAYGMPVAKKHKVICTFDAAKVGSCWLTDDSGAAIDYVNGDLSNSAGTPGTKGKIVKAFAGLRDDPFFFNLDGFKDVASTVSSAAGALTFDGAGCPKIDPATSMAIVTQLKSTMKGTMPAVDHFAKFNVLSIAVVIDKTALNDGGDIIGFWGSTNQ